MWLKYRLQTFLQFISFAFYPRTTLIACTVFSVIVIAILAVVMMRVPEDSASYNIAFALTTGATGSFFVSIIVELSSNFRNNKLAWQELQDYYSTVTDYEATKRVLLRNTSGQRAEKRAEDRSMDIIEATWKQLPKIIPVLKQTLEDKKAFLSDEEILELRVIVEDYKEIRHEIKGILQMSPMLYDILNNPDEGYLNYPQNIIDDMPDWIRKHLASNEGQNALERFTDAVMADDILLSRLMWDYEISIHGLEAYHSLLDDEEEVEQEYQGGDKQILEKNMEQAIEEDDDEYDFYEPDGPEEHRNYHIEMDKVFAEEQKPFVSWHISHCCKEIAASIDILERSILKKPYYSIRLRYDRDAQQRRRR